MDDSAMSERTATSSSSVSGSSATLTESKSSVKSPKIRTNLTLDLKQSSGAPNQLLIPATSGSNELKASPGFLLTSPDVQMLQLASPDLEKLLMQGLIGGNTPTPTTTQIIFPKTVTEEQESYAKGFVDALNALHRGGMSGVAYNVVNPQGGNVAFPINQVGTQNFLPQIFTLPTQQFQLQPMTQQFQQPSQNTGYSLQQPKLEPYSPSVSPVPSDPQTVPSDRVSVKSSNSSSRTSPINMEDQGKMKMERKRERNRIAAAKCRQRKLDRISELEDKVKALKDQNSALANTASQLRNDLHALKQELMMHVSSGCHIEMSDSLMQSMHEMAEFQHS